MTVAERMQAMGHHRPEIYDRHYLNEIIEADMLNILLGIPSNQLLMSLASHMSLTRDCNAPSKLTLAQINEVMADPDLVDLKMRRDAQRGALPGCGRRLKVAQVEDPVGHAEYIRLRKGFASLHKTLMNRKYEQVRANYFNTVDAHYIDQQHRGCVAAELPPAPAFEVAERVPLADLLFPLRCADMKPKDVVDWPSETHHCSLVCLLTALCSRRCSPARKTKNDKQNVYIEVEEDGETPDRYPVICPSTLCLSAWVTHRCLPKIANVTSLRAQIWHGT